MSTSLQHVRRIAYRLNRRVILPCVAPAVFITAFLLVLYVWGVLDVANAEHVQPRHDASIGPPIDTIFEDEDLTARSPGT